MGPVRIDANRTILELIDTGSIETDGSEELVTLVPEGGAWRVGILIHEGDSESVYDDFGGLQEGTPATPETESVAEEET